MSDTTFAQNTLSGLLYEEMIEIRLSHIRLIQGYIGKLPTVSHDNTVNVEMVRTDT